MKFDDREIRVHLDDLVEVKVDDWGFEDREDLEGMISEANLALNSLGIEYQGDYEISVQFPTVYHYQHLVMVNPQKELGFTPVQWIERLISIVSVADDILNEVLEDPSGLTKIKEENDPEIYGAALVYYQSMMSGLWGADDTCFDYHGSFVILILEHIKAALER